MSEDGISISRKTWSRVTEPLNKLGYMDGASDGQAAVFQSSFDSGYQQGFSFGFELGLFRSKSVQTNGSTVDTALSDQRRINCQFCLNNSSAPETITNLFNTQQEKNTALLKNIEVQN
ncbi:uncharacterized protein LOC115451529 [Manduca sexta]|uniref:uncharacterized protein LOC115451529 n=1 Tax=Manduca sexta TaxID=7130 RepID=UPI0011834100|nr:uncharacterized protein LOC115451529 [Manduca sexta]